MLWITSLDTPWMTTYAEVPYKEYPINDYFKDILTIDDLEKIESFPISPTNCRFTRNHEGKGIFMRDPEDCYVWSQDSEDGMIYTEDRNGIKHCVAKSLPEFLSRLEAEYIAWWKRSSLFSSK